MAEAADNAPAPKARELTRRVLSGIVLAVAALLTTWIGGAAFVLFWFAAGVVAAFEWLAMKGDDRRMLALGVVTGARGAMLAAQATRAPAFAVPAIGFVAMVVLFGTARSVSSFTWSLAALVYAILIGFVPAAARALPGTGIWVILWMFAVTWSTDVGAYAAGRTIGGPKLAPRLSPKKTWSGLAGGVAAGAIAGEIVVLLAGRAGHGLPASPAALFCVAIVAALLSQVGDILESAAKRRCGVKDSGWIIPGHGGVLDRLDGFSAVSLLVGAVLAASWIATGPGYEP